MPGPGKGRTLSPRGNMGSSSEINQMSGDKGNSRGANKGDGLNPGRQRGFNQSTNIETPTLNDMKAKQSALVSKFMTFANRKNTAMIELYERAFYNKRPCPTDLSFKY